MTEEGYMHIGAPPPAPAAPLLKKRRTELVVLTVVIVVGVLAAIGLASFYFIQQNRDIAVTGTLTLVDRDGYKSSGVWCTAKGGYDDIQTGAQVVVTDAAGTTIGIGKLGPGSNKADGCTFPFTVENVPTGHEFYGVEVARRGSVKYTPDRLKESVDLSIG